MEFAQFALDYSYKQYEFDCSYIMNFKILFIFRLEMCEHFDYKQDKSLASVRLVCKNAARMLKRKDSSGTFLKEGLVKKTDFT